MTTCNTRFFICRNCENIVGLINDSGIPLICCGEEMSPLVPGETDGSLEKHVPVVTVSGDLVEVAIGSAAHPMTEDHYIQWVYLQTDRGGQRKCLKPSESPAVKFALTGEKPEAVFAYCNLHGLWKTDI